MTWIWDGIHLNGETTTLPLEDSSMLILYQNHFTIIPHMHYDRAVNLITIATPTYNGSDDPENPANANSDSHVHFYSEFDGVQTTGASSFGSKKASRTYKSSGTTNVKVNDSNLVKMPDPVNPGMTKTGPLGPVESHFIHTRPELLKLD
jgi:hypothetical protein